MRSFEGQVIQPLNCIPAIVVISFSGGGETSVLVAALVAKKSDSVFIAGDFGKNIRAVLDEKDIR